MLLVVIIIQWIKNTALINIGNSILNLVFLMLLSCRRYKWLPPTCLVQHRIPPAGTITGKHKTHHMLTLTPSYTHFCKATYFALIVDSLRESFIFIQIPNHNFLTSHVIIHVCKCLRIVGKFLDGLNLYQLPISHTAFLIVNPPPINSQHVVEGLTCLC